MVLQKARELMEQSPVGAGHHLCALDFHLSDVKEIVLVGEPCRKDTQALIDEVYRHFLPNMVLVGKTDNCSTVAGLPLGEGREKMNDRATAFVCKNYVCHLPVNEPSELARQLAE